jgi:hypothetical protein
MTISLVQLDFEMTSKELVVSVRLGFVAKIRTPG